MNKVFSVGPAATNDTSEDRKSFSFGFSAANFEEVKGAASAKKSKSKPKKKKIKNTTEANLLETSCNASKTDSTTEATSCSPDHVSTNIASAIDLGMDAVQQNISAEPIQILCPLPLMPTSAEIETGEEVVKKKKKRIKKKSQKSAIEVEDEDMIFLAQEIALLATAQSAQIKPANSGIKISNKSPSNDDTAKDKKTSFSFKSHKDPELSEDQRSLNRFGNGKNLVAIGPPKHKGDDPIWKLPPPPGLKRLDDIEDRFLDESGVRNTNENGDKIIAPILSHCSPFSFGFGF